MMTSDYPHIRALVVSLRQLEKIEVFVKESGWDFPFEDSPKEKIETEIALILSVLENFDYDPIKAAACYKRANELAWAANEAVHKKIMAQIPGENKDVYDHFRTYEEAQQFLSYAAAKAADAFEIVFKQEFHDKLHFHEAMTRH